MLVLTVAVNKTPIVVPSLIAQVGMQILNILSNHVDIHKARIPAIENIVEVTQFHMSKTIIKTLYNLHQ